VVVVTVAVHHDDKHYVLGWVGLVVVHIGYF
jgi:hypothetical protein